MIRESGRWVGLIAVCLGAFAGSPSRSASAQDTPNTLMSIDGMTMLHQGLFRNGTPADGFNTFQFGPVNFVAGSLGRYNSFHFVNNSASMGAGEGGGVTNRARLYSNTPNHWNGTEYLTPAPLDITSDYFPVIDRATFGQVFDPTEYHVEVKFKPNLPGGALPVVNQAETFGVSMDVHGGYVWDAEAMSYKRAAEQVGYTIGSPRDGDYNDDGIIDAADYTVWRDHLGQSFTLPNERQDAATPGVVDQEDYNIWNFRFGTEVAPINDWYATAEKDADGFATWSVPLTQPTYAQRSFYFQDGNNDFRNQNTISNGGRMFDEDTQTWVDVNYGFGENFTQFGGGPEDPNNPGSKLNTPHGVSNFGFGSQFEGADVDRVLSVEIKSISVTRINPGAVVARIDANSGLTFRFGSGFTRSQTAAPIDIPDDIFGLGYLPDATDQISRFDENGITNLIFNMRTPDNAGETHRFLIRTAPGQNTFDGTEATVNVRAKLLDGNTVPTLTIVAKDLDGNDQAAMEGADEYTYDLDLSQFNSSTFTTVSIPLSDFDLSDFLPTPQPDNMPGSGPFGFANAGDGSIEEFNLYEFGGLIAPDTGVLRLELEFLEIRLPEGMGSIQLAGQAVPEPASLALLAWIVGAAMGIRKKR